MVEGRLYKKSDARHSDERLVVLEEILSTIARIHQRLGHAGYKKTFAMIEKEYYGVTHDEVEWVVSRCQNCIIN